jgi:hypothetical protein
VNLTLPDDSSPVSNSGFREAAPVNEFDGADALGDPRRRRRDGRARSAKRAKKTSKNTHEP